MRSRHVSIVLGLGLALGVPLWAQDTGGPGPAPPPPNPPRAVDPSPPEPQDPVPEGPEDAPARGPEDVPVPQPPGRQPPAQDGRPGPGGPAGGRDGQPGPGGAPLPPGGSGPGQGPNGGWPPTGGPTADEEEARAAAEGTEVKVERQGELERIRVELERLRRERLRLAGRELQLESSLRDMSDADTSPVIAPRVEILALTLEQAIAMALENNPDYLVEQLRALAAQEEVPIARAAFDPVLSFTGQFAKPNTPFFSANPFSGFPAGLNAAGSEVWTFDTSLTKRFFTGTSVRAFYLEQHTRTENQFALNPSYQPALGVEVTQPLLRGFGPSYNLAPLRIAENLALSADASYAEFLMAAVLAVEDTYWSLVRAEEQLRFQERSLESALKFLDDQRRRREVGAASDLDVVVAQAGVATGREGVIAAENGLEAARDALLRVVRPSSEASRWDVFIVPTDRPWMLPEPELEPERNVQIARERRPDLRRALLDIDTAEQTLVLRENEMLPQLDFFSTLREDGLGSTHHAGWSALGEGRFYSWSAGVRLDLPLFLRAERARARAARVDFDRAEAALRGAEADIVLEVRRAIRDVRTAKAQIEATRASRILAARRLRATRTQVVHGTAVPRDVLRDLADLAQTESREVQSFISYRLALSRLEQSKGTLLDRWLDKLEPRIRRALDRAPFDD